MFILAQVSASDSLALLVCMLPCRLPEGFSSMRRGERADWRCYRGAWGDVLQDAATALGSMRALQILLQPLSEMVAPKPFDWRTAELALHCLR